MSKNKREVTTNGRTKGVTSRSLNDSQSYGVTFGRDGRGSVSIVPAFGAKAPFPVESPQTQGIFVMGRSQKHRRNVFRRHSDPDRIEEIRQPDLEGAFIDVRLVTLKVVLHVYEGEDPPECRSPGWAIRFRARSWSWCARNPVPSAGSVSLLLLQAARRRGRKKKAAKNRGCRRHGMKNPG